MSRASESAFSTRRVWSRRRNADCSRPFTATSWQSPSPGHSTTARRWLALPSRIATSGGAARSPRRTRSTSAGSCRRSFYYFHAWAQLARAGRDVSSGPLVVATPSGNFGNLTAGLIAKRMGLPVDRIGRRDERERRRARLSRERRVLAARFRGDHLECDGRRRAEQFRPHPPSLRRFRGPAGGAAPGSGGPVLRGTRRPGGRSARFTNVAAISSIRTLPWAIWVW